MWAQETYIYIAHIYIQSSAPGALSTLVTSVVLYSLTRATLLSPGKDEARVCGYIYIYIYIYIYNLSRSSIDQILIQIKHKVE